MFKKAAPTVLVVLILVSPLFVSAQTSSEIRAQIDALLAKIAALQAQLQSKQGITTTTDAVSVSVLSPNEEGYYFYGQKLTVSWRQQGSVPKGSKACVTLRSESGGGGFAFPSGGGCLDIAGAETDRSVSQVLARSAGYDLAPGSYRASVVLVGPASTNGKDGPTLAQDQSDYYFKIVGNPVDKCGINSFSVASAVSCGEGLYRTAYIQCYDGYSVTLGGPTSCKSSETWQSYGEFTCYNRCSVPKSSPITVTAPNGGERWEIGQLNTIKWSPYDLSNSVNHINDVNVFLDRTDGTTVGRIMTTGKDSLPTYDTHFNIDGYDDFATPGTYYVRVQNPKTGATDRGDAPFTLLPRAIDIKVNGSDGPVTLSDNQPVTVTFTINTTFKSCMLSGVRETVGGGSEVEFGDKYPIGETFKGYAYAPLPGSSTSIYAMCTKTNGELRSDSVQVNMGGAVASPVEVKIKSPNGGEKIVVNEQTFIRFNQAGLKSFSIALYKNNARAKWIARNVVPKDDSLNYAYAWTPSDDETRLVPLGSVFKIYVIGERADGKGSVEDKSDGSFKFVLPSRRSSVDTKLNFASAFTAFEKAVLNSLRSTGN